MRVAVISDIHANLPALEAVAEAIAAEAPDEVWCVGDLVGYGPHPNPCCEWVAKHVEVCVAGNHDLGVLGTLDLAVFSDDAAVAALWTREELSAPSSDYLSALAPTAEREGVGIYHGSPRDPVWEYIFTWEGARDAIEESSHAVTLVGHTHFPIAVGEDDDPHAGHAPGGTEIDLSGRWLLNPGSVGQPRDGDPAAAWLLLDLDEGHASFRRVEYDVASAQADIREQGLPDALAERLAHGL